MSRTIIESVEGEYRRYHDHTLRALAQIDAAQLNTAGPGGNNSIAVIIQHVAGNLRSRFTDFLTTDGEKPDRNRDTEFEERTLTMDDARALWSSGFEVMRNALAALDDSQLTQTVTIRQQPLSVIDALHRSLAHTAMHAGQIIYLAKSLQGEEWQTLTIPKGKSAAYNANPNAALEKPPR